MKVCPKDGEEHSEADERCRMCGTSLEEMEGEYSDEDTPWFQDIKGETVCRQNW